MKRILITNDDGIRSSGIIRLVEAARALGEVTVIAPDREHSAKAHSISILEPVDFMPYAFPVPGVTAWVCSGTPSDCVRVGLAYLLPQKPDLVLSGINCGFNIASDIQYSATVGAALEAAHQGIPAAAFSEPYNPDHSVTDRFLPDVLELLEELLPGRDEILNINFPLASCNGILTGRTVSSGSMFRGSYQLTERLPGGGLRLSAEWVPDDACDDGSDFRAVLDHYISIGVVRNIG